MRHPPTASAGRRLIEKYLNIPLNDDVSTVIVWHDRRVDVAGSDRLVERLHRLLVVLEDESHGNGSELPPVAVFDVRAQRWLLASGVSLATLRQPPAVADAAVRYLLIAGAITVPVCSSDDSVLMAEFSRSVRVGVIF
jgi:hypothetical protein